MPKIICKCGYIHDLSPIPDEGYLVIKDKDYEQLLDIEHQRKDFGQFEEGSKEFDELCKLDDYVVSHTERIYVCPDCGYLVWMNDESYKFYKPE